MTNWHVTYNSRETAIQIMEYVTLRKVIWQHNMINDVYHQQFCILYFRVEELNN